MSTFLFYNPNSNPSRYSQKARFSKRQSILLVADNPAPHSQPNFQPAFNYGSQPVYVENSQEPSQNSGCSSSQSDQSDVESLHSLFSGSKAKPNTRAVEEFNLPSPSGSTLFTSLNHNKLPVADSSFIAQTDPRPNKHGLDDTRGQRPDPPVQAPDLATYCLNLSPSPVLQAQGYEPTPDRAPNHQLGLTHENEPWYLDEPVALVDEDIHYATRSNDDMQVDLEHEYTRDGQNSLQLTLGYPGLSDLSEPITSPWPTEQARLDSPCLLGDSGENVHTPSHDSLVCPEGEGYIDSLDVPRPLELRTDETEDPSSQMDVVHHPTPAALSTGILPHQGRRKHQKRVAEFSHVEIPSYPGTNQASPQIAADPDLDRPNESCAPPLLNGPWRLDGTILSIDIRDAQRIPISVGYSSFRVSEGHLTQSLTLFQGLVDPPSTTMACGTKRRSPSTCARGPLSSEQKRHLLQLKNEGYTWDEIVTRFPGRKKSSLQAIYSANLKNIRSSVPVGVKLRKASRGSTSSANDRALAGITGNAGFKSRQMLQARKPRYNFRSRGSQ